MALNLSFYCESNKKRQGTYFVAETFLGNMRLLVKQSMCLDMFYQMLL
jgi:hypothetical protein